MIKYKYILFTKSDSGDYYTYVINAKEELIDTELDKWLELNANDKVVDEGGLELYEEIIKVVKIERWGEKE